MRCVGAAFQKNIRDLGVLYFCLKFGEFYWLEHEKVAVIAGVRIWWCPGGSLCLVAQGRGPGSSAHQVLMAHLWDEVCTQTAAMQSAGWLDGKEWYLVIGTAGWERTMLPATFLQQHLFGPLRASGPKASLLAEESACLVLWVGFGFSPWAPAAMGGKPVP